MKTDAMQKGNPPLRLHKNTRISVLLVIAAIVLAFALYYSDELEHSGESMAATAPIEIGPPETAPAPDRYRNVQIRLFSEFIRSENYKVFPRLAIHISEMIHDIAEEYSVPPEYLLAITSIESAFNHAAVSSANCIGLMQINPEVWVQDETNESGLRVNGLVSDVLELYDPEVNIRAGAYILTHYLQQAEMQEAEHPLKYALTRYLGGISNDHYAKFESALGKWFVFAMEASEKL
jgi:soluble lytic murein transglycosylase-like protein